ncbi:MAG: CarD family transcriptional regulator, partial [Candidatus Puniceispirillaceae bacterium]
ATQRSGDRMEQLVLRPVAEFQLDDAAVERFRTGYRAAFGALASRDALYESVSAGRMHPGAEHWLPLFHESLARLTDYCPQWQLVLDHEADAAIAARLTQIDDFFAARRDTADEDGSMAYRPLPRDRLYLDADELDRVLTPAARLMPFAAPPEAEGNDAGGNDAEGNDAGGRAGVVLTRAQTSQSVMAEVADLIAAERKADNRTVVIAGAGDGAMARLDELAQAHLGVEIRHPDGLDDLVAGAVHLIDWPLEAGFQTAQALVITETDIFGQRLSRPRSRRGRGEDFLREVSALEEGDLVVHAEHGIGRYEGLMIIDSSGGPHDCLQIVYAGGDKLYLPVENIEMLSRYGSAGTDAQLDRLGGAAWQARVARIKGRVRIMAEQLINIAAQRQTARAEPLQPEAGSFSEFCARFGFAETDDQLGAIEDVVDDLASGRATDRLICGDVGFGKTEVALRAAFIAAMSGYQVALVAPTTLLARQHGRLFAERFAGFPVKIGVLS